MTKEEIEIISMVKSEVSANGKCVLPMSVFASKLNLNRKEVKALISNLIKDGHLKGKTEWIKGTKRWSLKPRKVRIVKTKTTTTNAD